MKRWTIKETEELEYLYNKMNNEELVLRFNRTFLSIYKKARSLGLYKTKEMEFINRSNARIGSKSPCWKGGRKKTNKGYIYKMEKGHHRSTADGYVLEHILIMERHLNRRIGEDEVVHHRNGIKSDNRVENLEVMSFGEHTRLHHLGSKRSLSTRKKISDKAKEFHQNKRSVVNE